MQKDFHYYCIAVLANKAGFSKEDALTIAYASAYVDNQDNYQTYYFDDEEYEPVRTAHVGIKAFQWHIKRDVFIPFHFLPSEEGIGKKHGLIVKPFPKIAERIFNEALKEEDKKLKLIRIGVALHTIADTWAHQGFSGIKHDENKVKNLSIELNGITKTFNPNPEFINIGHAIVDCNPDNPALCWDFDYELNHIQTEKIINITRFISASEVIYNLLLQVTNDCSNDWDDVKSLITPYLEYISDELLAQFPHDENISHKYFNDELERRSNNWEVGFPELFDEPYDENLWWNQMKPNLMSLHDWNEMQLRHYDRFSFKKPENFEQKNWILFNEAARLQRTYIQQALPFKEKLEVM